MDKVQNAVLLDLDGTLIDSVFCHVVAWDAEAARRVRDSLSGGALRRVRR